ncbi:hypothetical protein [Streptomyces sp. NRRL B-24085]|uniref:hypothetical protein n=1 Tax=Streptomyces sp. NRRL B-24085 TaxID=1709476 RepID=UPI00131BDF7C|nr:hypothetical protein [Streptomyces sp. NRRL B-24085]
MTTALARRRVSFARQDAYGNGTLSTPTIQGGPGGCGPERAVGKRAFEDYVRVTGG